MRFFSVLIYSQSTSAKARNKKFMYPNDAQTAKATQATGTTATLIPISTGEITILNVHMDKAAQASQLLQCNQNGGSPFYTLIQAVGTDSQDVSGQWRFPAGTSCYLKTFDNTLTYGAITWVNRDVSFSTKTPAYINGFSYGEIIISFLLLLLFTGSFFSGILNRLIGIKVKKPNY